MAPKVQKDANGNTICRRDSQGRKIACAKCIKGHRTSMCKPSHTEGVRVIDGVGRKQGTKSRRKNGRSAADMVESLLQQRRDHRRGLGDGSSVASLQNLPQMQAAFWSEGSTPQSAQGPQFPTRPNWVAPVPGVGPYPQRQAHQPAGNLGAAPSQQQQGKMAQQLAGLGVWHDPMQRMQAYHPFGYPEPDFDQLMQIQEPQSFADPLRRGAMAGDPWMMQPLPPNLGSASNGVPLHQNPTPSQHPVPVQAPKVDNLADRDQFNKRFPLTPETLKLGTGLLQELRREKALQ